MKSTDPLDVLRRLPKSLFNFTAPEGGELGSLFDVDTFHTAVFGEVLPDPAPTIQYELARWIAEEKDRFFDGLNAARALQLGLGDAVARDGRVVGASDRASGPDLDRVGAQFGIGRPLGFTDCCYWRLIVLCLFTAGPTLWRMREIAALYTGTRPRVVEAPAKITFIWPGAEAEAFWDIDGYWSDGDADESVWWDENEALPEDDDTDGYWSEGAAHDTEAFWDAEGISSISWRLIDALTFVKPAGVYVELQDAPAYGVQGCGGATRRDGGEPPLGKWS